MMKQIMMFVGNDLRGLAAGTVGVALALVLAVSPAVAQDSAEPLNLRLGDVSMNKLPFVIAYDKGLFDKNGLSLVPKFSKHSIEIIRRSGVDVPDEFILQNEDEFLPISVGGASPTIYALTTKAGASDPIMLGSTHSETRWRIVARPDITSAEQLKGKRIGFSGNGAVTHLGAMLFTRAMGWDPQFDVSLMSGALGVDALQKGYVDAMIAPELHATMAIDAGFPAVVDMADLNLPTAGSSFLFDREWLKDNRDLARRFIKSTVEALAILKTDKKAAFETMGKWYQMHDPELMEQFYDEATKVPRKPYPPVEGIRKVMEIYDSHEMRKYTLEHFYDDSFVRELDESGYIDNLYE